MNEEEIKAIKNMKIFARVHQDMTVVTAKDMDIVLNLIEKKQTEIEKKNKQIDLMAEYMAENMAEFELDEIYEKQYNCNGMERNWTRGKETEIKDIKQYFEKKVEEASINE